MIIDPAEKGGLAWTSLNSPTLGPTHTKSPLMRNGLRHTYAQMNTARNAGYIYYATASGAPAQLASAYRATTLQASTFVSDASDDVKKRFATWTEYIRQTLRVNGAPGTPFGMTDTGVKVHEFGRYMGRLAYAAGLDDYPAFKSCYEHGEGGGTWWLPSMFELGELMIDEHLNKLNQNSSSVFGSISAASIRWSCVRVSTSLAWTYNNLGLSDYYGFSYTFAVRPVTLLKLV